uniref:Methyltransferase domain-containing protein n=1 Tax=mine drainage metagenome TaxID=410659 RepID=E6Q6Y0_9ZZZZ
MTDEQRTYWEKKIIAWEGSMRGASNPRSVPFLERAAAPFRKSLILRLEVAERLLKNQIAGKIVADLGCGSGMLARNLSAYGPSQVIGVDIALPAVQTAQQRSRDAGIAPSLVDFVCKDVRYDTDFLAKVDVVVGVGFLDYLNKDECLALFRSIRGKAFLFSSPVEKEFSLRALLRQIYLKLAGCPGSYRYSRAELDDMFRGMGNIHHYNKNSIRFVTNLPIGP